MSSLGLTEIEMAFLNIYWLTVWPVPAWKNELTGQNHKTSEDSKSISGVLKNKIQLMEFKNLIDFI